MAHSLSLSSIVLLLVASAAGAADWVSPDGKIAFHLPDPDVFVAVKSPPAPFLAQWSLRDGSTNIAVLTVANPTDTPLVQKGLETGTLKSTGGSLVSSSQTTL